MSARINVVSGSVAIRIDGEKTIYTAGVEVNEIEYQAPLPINTQGSSLSEWFVSQVVPLMERDLNCPAIGSASEPFHKVAGSVLISADGGPVELQVYSPKTSVHPDERAAESCEVKLISLDDGDMYEVAMHDDNAYTVMVISA